MTSKNTICLWYDGTALEADTFYAETIPVTPGRRPGVTQGFEQKGAGVQYRRNAEYGCQQVMHDTSV